MDDDAIQTAVVRVANAGTSVDIASDAGGSNPRVVAVNGVTLGTPVPVDRAATPYAATGTIPPLTVDPTTDTPVAAYTWSLDYINGGWHLTTLAALGDVVW